MLFKIPAYELGDVGANSISVSEAKAFRQVDGVYSADPRKDKNAKRYDALTYMDVLNQGLKVMDPTSITFCMDNALPIVVFDVLAPGNLRRVLVGEERIGTLVR